MGLLSKPGKFLIPWSKQALRASLVLEHTQPGYNSFKPGHQRALSRLNVCRTMLFSLCFILTTKLLWETIWLPAYPSSDVFPLLSSDAFPLHPILRCITLHGPIARNGIHPCFCKAKPRHTRCTYPGLRSSTKQLKCCTHQACLRMIHPTNHTIMCELFHQSSKQKCDILYRH